MRDVERLAKRTKIGRRALQARRGLRAVRLVRSILGVLLGLVLVAVLLGALVILITGQADGSLLTSAGETRRYILYVPDSYDGSSPAPLVISIHGYMDWPAHQEQMTGWDALADEYGFIVVYPMGLGTPKRWRASGGAGEQALADVVFISELIDKLAGEYNLDADRIYVNGLSNGAGMSMLLGCKLPQRVAALGLVAGAYLLPWEECTSGRGVPAVVFHGTQDPIVPYEGGPSESFDVPFPNIPVWVDALAQHNGCSGVKALPESGAVSGKEYTDCDADVTFYIIEGGGHTWPGGEPLPESITGVTSEDIDATAVIWEFYQAHPLR